MKEGFPMGVKANGKAADGAVAEMAISMAPQPLAPESATLLYAPGWQEVQAGDIAQGGQLTVQYDQGRLIGCQAYHDGMPAWDSSASIRFHPSGQIVSGPLVAHLSGPGGIQQVLDPPKPIPVAALVPLDAVQVELWFERHSIASEHCQVWDSRFGQNYWYGVARRGPTEQVGYRFGAIPRLDMVNVFTVGAEKRDGFPPPPTGGKVGTDLETLLHITVWVKNAAYAKNVWMDVHVFDGSDHLVHAETFTIPYCNGAGGGGDFFTFDGPVYQGTKATPGSVSPRPDARKIQFRVYYEVNDQLFTDAILYQETVSEDAVIG
jgi:hypothetical protein